MREIIQINADDEKTHPESNASQEINASISKQDSKNDNLPIKYVGLSNQGATCYMNSF